MVHCSFAVTTTGYIVIIVIIARCAINLLRVASLTGGNHGRSLAESHMIRELELGAALVNVLKLILGRLYLGKFILCFV